MLYDPKWETPETSPLEPWRDLMLRAADILESSGLVKNQLCDASGRVCFRGALMAAMGGDQTDPMFIIGVLNDRENKRLFHEADFRMEQHVGTYPPRWNNVPERTKEEVVAAMRIVARVRG